MSQALQNPDIAAMIRHGVRHAAAGTMDLADSQMRLPAARYTDPDRLRLESERIFRRLPLMLAASCELPNPGDYKTMEVVGVPLLLIRGEDRVMRAFVNSCSHRGAAVATEARGNARRLSCPFHGWTFGQKGELIGVASSEDFGSIDKSCHGLAALPTAERAGLVFVTLAPGSKLDIDRFLSGFDRLIGTYDLANWHFFASRRLPSANWKFAYEATMDYYHLPVLHRNTLTAGGGYGNRALYFGWGPHQRIMNPDSRLKRLAATPEAEWTDTQVMGGNWEIFPNSELASFNGGFADGYSGGRALMIMQIWPGDTPDSSWTDQIYLLEQAPRDEAAAAQSHAQFELLGRAVGDEDNVVGFAQQKAMASGLVDGVTFGRNEGGLQAFHHWLDRIIAADDGELAALF